MEAIRTCMFVTHDAGMMRALPMAAIPDRAENSVRFFTARTSAKPEELRDDQRCCLVFHQSDGGVFLSVSGRTRLSRDSDLMRRKWDREADLWFPLGPGHPDVLLLHVLPEAAEYWTRPGDFDSVAREVRAARAEGREPRIGENARIDFCQ
jgi:general stress protein 26